MQLLKNLLSPQVQAGSKVVQVGSRIGVLAEQGDDLGSLELPSEDSPGPGPRSADTQSAKKDTTSPAPEDRPTQVESSAKSTPETSYSHATPKTPHTSSPSVAHLIHTHGITKDDISRIPATGPKGRLLKGDVLAFLGKIQKSWPKELEGRIHKSGKLDLSNIKAAAPRKKAETPKNVEERVELPKNAEVKVEVSFSEVLKVQSKLQGTSTICTPNFPRQIIDIPHSCPRRPPPPIILHRQSHHQSQQKPPSLDSPSQRIRSLRRNPRSSHQIPRNYPWILHTAGCSTPVGVVCGIYTTSRARHH